MASSAAIPACITRQLAVVLTDGGITQSSSGQTSGLKNARRYAARLRRSLDGERS